MNCAANAAKLFIATMICVQWQAAPSASIGATFQPTELTRSVNKLAILCNVCNVFTCCSVSAQIMRCNVDGSRVEMVASNAVAHSLAVDSGRGLIVWADQFGVYTANLSGKGYRALYETHISRGFVGSCCLSIVFIVPLVASLLSTD